MKKWLDDLYAILLKRGFNTLDNVLKKYKTQVEDFQEIKINDELINLNPNDTLQLDLSNYFNLYDRFTVYNRGGYAQMNIMSSFYKYRDDAIDRYSTVNNLTTVISLTFTENKYLNIKNMSTAVIKFDIYVKKTY